jgi:lipopolysaccharide/colanic/teichoic acid biosynthesis glycosyltransferase
VGTGRHDVLLPQGVQLVAEEPRYLYHAGKRCLDVVVAVILLALFVPVLVTIAIAIKLDSPGPVVFRQRRQGVAREVAQGQGLWLLREFSIFKFRTMADGVSSSLHEEHIAAFVDGRLQANDSSSAFKLRRDPRVTRVGRFLRRTSLDEFPQLVNVLMGTMSLVGPRPVPVYEATRYPTEYRARFSALPGLTGLWQVNGRCSVSFEEMIRFDLEYVNTKSMSTDIRILLKTIPAVVSGRGAG